MKILVTGATGYIGNAVSWALLERGHRVHGLARTPNGATKLERQGVTPVFGDFNDLDSLRKAVVGVDAVISTASTGSLAGDERTFAADRDAIAAIADQLKGSGKPLIFTSGSEALGVFANGRATDSVYAEDTVLPLPHETFAPISADVHPLVSQGLMRAMRARIETEQIVLNTEGIFGMVIRPGLVFGDGGSYDIPGLIRMARARGAAPHLGAGETLQGYVHVEDLADLYRLAIESPRHGAIWHGVADEISQIQLANAVSRLDGCGGQTESLSLVQMFGIGGSIGVSLSLNKRLSSHITKTELCWRPLTKDILRDIQYGSYRY